jgi:hypothetical protein
VGQSGHCTCYYAILRRPQVIYRQLKDKSARKGGVQRNKWSSDGLCVACRLRKKGRVCAWREKMWHVTCDALEKETATTHFGGVVQVVKTRAWSRGARWQQHVSNHNVHQTPHTLNNINQPTQKSHQFEVDPYPLSFCFFCFSYTYY